MDIGKNLKSIRKIYCLTQQDVATKLHVTPQAVSRWERNEVSPSIDVLQDLSEYFELSLDVITAKNLDYEAVHNNYLKIKERDEAKQQEEQKLIEQESVIEYKNPFVKFIKTRGIGFYILLAAIVLCFSHIIMYAVEFKPGTDNYRYYNVDVIICLSFAIIVSLALSLYKHTEAYAGISYLILIIVSLCLFAYHGYMYFTTVFFSGFSWDAFWEMNTGFLGSIFIFIAMLLLGILIQCFPMTHIWKSHKKVKEVKTTNDKEN